MTLVYGYMRVCQIIFNSSLNFPFQFHRMKLCIEEELQLPGSCKTVGDVRAYLGLSAETGLFETADGVRLADHDRIGADQASAMKREDKQKKRHF